MRLKKPWLTAVLRFGSLTYITALHKLNNVTLHLGPSKQLLDSLIGCQHPRVPSNCSCVERLHDVLLGQWVVAHPDLSFVTQHTFLQRVPIVIVP